MVVVAKTKDTETPVNFRTCAPLQYKRNIIEGTVYMVCGSTFRWNFYHKALLINSNMQQKKEDQILEDWSFKVELRMLKNWAQLKATKKQTQVTNESRNAKRLILILQYQEIA